MKWQHQIVTFEELDATLALQAKLGWFIHTVSPMPVEGTVLIVSCLRAPKKGKGKK